VIKLPPRPATPAVFDRPEVRGMIRHTAEFYDLPERSRRQHKFEFPLYPPPLFDQAMKALLKYSSGKCAYCEKPIEHPGDATLERLRPKAGALNKDGKFSTEHYWWLAYDWRNIYPACATCNKVKGSKFPVHGKRCEPRTAYEELTSEQALLIDPGYDEPADHLAFQPDGTVQPRTPRGDATIATFELNRGDVRARRHSVAKRTRAILANQTVGDIIAMWGAQWFERLTSKAEKNQNADEGLADLKDVVIATAPSAATARALVEQHIYEADEKGASRSVRAAGPAAAAAPKRKAPRVKVRKPVMKAKPPQPTKRSALQSQIITRLEVKNFRGIADIDLPVDYSVGLGAPWTVMLGENGTGKSSILQAIALTLLSDSARGPAVRPSQVLRKGASAGHVRVWFHSADQPRQLEFRRGARAFERSGPEYLGTLLGYGATRLLPRSREQVQRGSVRLRNMFDPFAPLIDAERWLGRLQKRPFDFVARALRDVLDMPRNARLKRVRSTRSSGVRLKQFGTDLTLGDLSDGYQSVLGLTCDIISGLRALQPGALDASEAVVIIDELGAHLHPRWRMRIVAALRRAFKRVQFISSTHDPLCLRGLENGEVVVLKRTPRGRVYPVPDLPPVKGLRVDQLLTSEFFGLDSTLDPAIESKYRELYKLLAIDEPKKQTKKVKTRIKELQAELAPYEIPGATRRERRLLQVIDRELARLDATEKPTDRAQIRAENEKIVQALLENKVSGAAA
jgi:hypothetical protein